MRKTRDQALRLSMIALCTGCTSHVVVTDAVAPTRALEAVRAGMLPTAVVTPKGRVTIVSGTILASDGLWAWDPVPKPVAGQRPKPRTARRFYAFTRADRIEVTGNYAQGDVVPIGGSVVSSKSTGLAVTGGVVFGLSYAIAGVGASVSPLSVDRKLWIPLVGPWMNLATRPQCVTPPELQSSPGVSSLDPCKADYAAKVGIAADGVLQGAGVLLFALGMMGSSKWAPAGQVAVVPDANGLRVLGTF